MKKYLLFFSLIMISVSALHAQKAAKTDFNKIGETIVDFKSGSGTVTITGGAYKALRLTTDAPVHIESLTVVYQNGAPENIPVRYDFKPGIQSRDINLQGTKNNIKEVDFVYKQVVKTNADKATVEVFGTK